MEELLKNEGVKGRRGRQGGIEKDISRKAEEYQTTVEPPYDSDDIISAYESGMTEGRKNERVIGDGYVFNYTEWIPIAVHHYGTLVTDVIDYYESDRGLPDSQYLQTLYRHFIDMANAYYTHKNGGT